MIKMLNLLQTVLGDDTSSFHLPLYFLFLSSRSSFFLSSSCWKKTSFQYLSTRKSKSQRGIGEKNCYLLQGFCKQFLIKNQIIRDISSPCCELLFFSLWSVVWRRQTLEKITVRNLHSDTKDGKQTAFRQLLLIEMKTSLWWITRQGSI